MDRVQALNALKNTLVKTSDLRAFGISSYEIRKLVSDGKIERVKQGYYILQSDEGMREEELIAKLFPDGVLCMNTALFYHGYTNRTPMAWDIAIDKNTSKSRFRLDYPYVQPHYLEPHLLAFGVTTCAAMDNTMKIFDRDRLICECLIYEKKMDRETYNKALQMYVADAEKNIAKLLKYAAKRRVLQKAKDRIGVWL